MSAVRRRQTASVLGGVEGALLVLLHVLVVGQREALHHRQEAMSAP
jgi:hypothetical protein